LFLQQTKVTDAGLKHLPDWPGLKLLYRQGSQVTKEGVNEYRKAFPKCHLIYWAQFDALASGLIEFPPYHHGMTMEHL
jgi:hypothetical protein